MAAASELTVAHRSRRRRLIHRYSADAVPPVVGLGRGGLGRLHLTDMILYLLHFMVVPTRAKAIDVDMGLDDPVLPAPVLKKTRARGCRGTWAEYICLSIA